MNGKLETGKKKKIMIISGLVDNCP